MKDKLRKQKKEKGCYFYYQVAENKQFIVTPMMWRKIYQETKVELAKQRVRSSKAAATGEEKSLLWEQKNWAANRILEQLFLTTTKQQLLGLLGRLWQGTGMSREQREERIDSIDEVVTILLPSETEYAQLSPAKRISELQLLFRLLVENLFLEELSQEQFNSFIVKWSGGDANQ